MTTTTTMLVVAIVAVAGVAAVVVISRKPPPPKSPLEQIAGGLGGLLGLGRIAPDASHASRLRTAP